MRVPLPLILSAALAGCIAEAAAPPSAPSVAVAGPATPVVQIDEAKQWRTPPGTASLLKLAQGDNAFVAQLTMKPGAQVPTHRDPTEEYVYVLAGGGVLTLDGQAHTLQPGSSVYMAPDVEVSFVAGEQGATVLQVFAGPGPAAKYDRWVAP